jgi:RNA polymerase sigma-70 factor (ECF subfamily)
MREANVIEADRNRDQVKTGDTVFAAFFEDEYPRLVRALIPSTRGIADAEEAAQEAMIRVFERWDRVGKLASPGGYAYVTAVNWLRRRSRRRWLPLFNDTPDPRPDPFEALERRDALLSALARLSTTERDVLLLVSFYGLSASEAGEILGLEPASVRSRVHRARKALRAMEEEQDEDR